MKLYEIADYIEIVINEGLVFDEDTGEVIFDSDNFDKLEESLDEKLENIGIVVKNKQAESDAIANEIKNLQSRKKRLDNEADRLKNYAMYNMERIGQNKLETSKVRISIRKSKYLDIGNESNIPEDFKTIEEILKIDKRGITDAIKAGEEIDGCELKERSSITVK